MCYALNSMASVISLFWIMPVFVLIYSHQVEVHDVGKEMELDLIKQYSQVCTIATLNCSYTLLINVSMLSKHSIFRLSGYLLIG
jgi:hypothetical protein